MAKTYNSIPTVSTGDVYTATAHNNIVTNVNNYRVPPACIAYRNTAQSTTNSTITAVSFTTAGVDTDGMFSAGSPTRITVQTPGIYMVTANLSLDANVTGQRELSVVQTSTSSPTWNIQWLTSSAVVNPTINLYAEMSCSAITTAIAGDYFTMQAWQNSGGALNIVGNVRSTFMSVTWLGQVS